jgi:hypothetical protein
MMSQMDQIAASTDCRVACLFAFAASAAGAALALLVIQA